MTAARLKWYGWGREGEGLTADGEAGGDVPSPPAALPRWLFERAAPEGTPVRLRPSDATVSAGAERRAEGVLAHALLQLLPGVEADRRREAARSHVRAHGAALPEAACAALVDQVLAVIAAPGLAPLFGPASRGEVPFAGALRRPNRADLPFAGRLDRLAVTEKAVRIVDFKLGRAPARPSPAHVVQLALYRAALRPLYPSRPIVAALVYLDGPEIRPLSEEELDAALDVS